jgi:hypothetical protein
MEVTACLAAGQVSQAIRQSWSSREIHLKGERPCLKGQLGVANMVQDLLNKLSPSGPGRRGAGVKLPPSGRGVKEDSRVRQESYRKGKANADPSLQSVLALR